jgi:hypothetical protein
VSSTHKRGTFGVMEASGLRQDSGKVMLVH